MREDSEGQWSVMIRARAATTGSSRADRRVGQCIECDRGGPLMSAGYAHYV